MLPLDSPLLEAADHAHSILCCAAGIKASPPSYSSITTRLSTMLIELFAKASGPIIGSAIRKLAAISDREGTLQEKQASVDAEIRRLRDGLTAAGISLVDREADLLKPALMASYKLGLREIAQQAGVLPEFALADADAIAGMGRNGLYWVGKAYGDMVPMGTINAVVEDIVLRRGLGAAEAGKQLEKMLRDPMIRRSEAYWTGFSHTVSTRSRSYGAISSMVRLGVTEYEYINPMDERTSEVCAALDGKIFRVEHAVKLRDRLLEAKDPEEWKSISPWPRVQDIQNEDGSLKTIEELVAMGVIMPPLHFYCRSSIQIR